MAGSGELPIVECHALVCAAGSLRIWVGVFDERPVQNVTWRVDEIVVAPDQVTVVRQLAAVPPGPPTVITQSGVFDLPYPADGSIAHKVQVTAHWADGRAVSSSVLSTRALPERVPTGLTDSFNVLLVSCFFGGNDAFGLAGSLVANRLTGPYQPHLVLTVGDQVYLDNPPYKALHFDANNMAAAFERQYRANWQGPGYADILQAGPVAAIPDDHEYWNNYPQRGTLWPATWFAANGLAWASNARAMFEAYQQAVPDIFSYSFDVPPLSFFMMDNRTFREQAGIDEPARSLRPEDLNRYESWVARVLREELLPVLCTGPSLIQQPARWFKGVFVDRNFANYTDYASVTQGILRMSDAGLTPLLLTGDVHYPRVTKATHAGGRRGWSDFFEVISSPTSLVSGSHKPSQPADESFRLDSLGDSLKCKHLWPIADRADTRNHVCLLRFRSLETGVTVEPLYWMIDGPARSRNPLAAPVLTLQRFPGINPQP